MDAYWYAMDKTNPDYIVSYKHEPMANHTYLAMAFYCQTHHFKHSQWNRMAPRRQAFLMSRQIIEGRTAEPMANVQITPTEASFVNVEEKCTAIDEMALDVNQNPPDQEVIISYNISIALVFDILEPSYNSSVVCSSGN